jgi:hypothetical protein
MNPKSILIYQLLKNLLPIIKNTLYVTQASHLKYTTNVPLHTIVCVKWINTYYIFKNKSYIRKICSLGKAICEEKGEWSHIFIILNFIIFKKIKEWDHLLLFYISYKIYVFTIYLLIKYVIWIKLYVKRRQNDLIFL